MSKWGIFGGCWKLRSNQRCAAFQFQSVKNVLDVILGRAFTSPQFARYFYVSQSVLEHRVDEPLSSRKLLKVRLPIAAGSPGPKVFFTRPFVESPAKKTTFMDCGRDFCLRIFRPFNCAGTDSWLWTLTPFCLSSASHSH